MIATALFSHSVRCSSFLVLCAKIELRGGIVAAQVCLSTQKKRLSGAEGGLRVLRKPTTRLISLIRTSSEKVGSTDFGQSFG